MNKKIGIFDSGLGGLSILRELIRILPNEDYLFYEDSINNPYGEKSEEELFVITSKIVDYLLNNECKIIVIACNTATTSCISKLREKYPDTTFVGTVPAIKVAYDNNYKKTIVLSTPYTMNSKRVEELIDEYHNPNQVITNISGENLANLIEENRIDEIRDLLNRILSSYNDYDSIVLGCTHYSLIKDEIKKVLPNAELIDGSIGVAREVKHQLEINSSVSSSENSGNITIINTKDSELIKRSFELLR